MYMPGRMPDRLDPLEHPDVGPGVAVSPCAVGRRPCDRVDGRRPSVCGRSHRGSSPRSRYQDCRRWPGHAGRPVGAFTAIARPARLIAPRAAMRRRAVGVGRRRGSGLDRADAEADVVDDGARARRRGGRPAGRACGTRPAPPAGPGAPPSRQHPVPHPADAGSAGIAARPRPRPRPPPAPRRRAAGLAPGGEQLAQDVRQRLGAAAARDSTWRRCPRARLRDPGPRRADAPRRERLSIVRDRPAGRNTTRTVVAGRPSGMGSARLQRSSSVRPAVRMIVRCVPVRRSRDSRGPGRRDDPIRTLEHEIGSPLTSQQRRVPIPDDSAHLLAGDGFQVEIASTGSAFVSVNTFVGPRSRLRSWWTASQTSIASTRLAWISSIVSPHVEAAQHPRDLPRHIRCRPGRRPRRPFSLDRDDHRRPPRWEPGLNVPASGA